MLKVATLSVSVTSMQSQNQESTDYLWKDAQGCKDASKTLAYCDVTNNIMYRYGK